MGGLIPDGVDGIEPEAVEVEGEGQASEVFQEEVPHMVAVRPVEVQGIAPGGAGGGGKVGAEVGEVISLGAQMVIDHVEKDREPPEVGLPDKPQEAVRPPVGPLDGVGEDPVVSPVPCAGKLGQGHELKGCDAGLDQMVEEREDSVEVGGRGKGSHMELVEDLVSKRGG